MPEDRALATVVVTTRDRPEQLAVAVESALGQSLPVDVVVVDDGSSVPVRLPQHPRLRVLRHERSAGVSAARNAGASAACTRWVTFLDDDDRHRPNLVEASLAAVEQSTLPRPVGVVSALAVVRDGAVVAVRTPPAARPRGDHFQLEPAEPGTSYHGKQTLVVERDVLLGIGGFDPSFASRVTTELFLRLNPVCSILGIPDVTYDFVEHSGGRISTDQERRLRSFRQLEQVHHDALRAHPSGYAELLVQHGRTCAEQGLRVEAARALGRAVRTSPGRAVGCGGARVAAGLLAPTRRRTGRSAGAGPTA